MSGDPSVEVRFFGKFENTGIMVLLLRFSFALFFACIFGCTDFQNIKVTGKITNAQTGIAIANAEVVVICWYKSDPTDESFRKATLVTDANGKYEASFAAGNEVDVASKSKDFLPARSFNKLKSNQIDVNLQLAISSDNPNLIVYRNDTLSNLYHTSKTAFLRISIPIRNNIADSTNLMNILSYGFDFRSLTTSIDTTNCDIWFRASNNGRKPGVLVAHRGGGIIPVYRDQAKSSFLFDMPIAPQTGYTKEYHLKGNEEGFFVLCRDGRTFAKIIFEKSEIETGSYSPSLVPREDIGKYFTYLYQPDGTRNLTYSSPSINLEHFLVSLQMR
jgi:hypothetical protein